MLPGLRKPRCFLVYALAPEGITAAQANTIFNNFVADKALPLVVYHDHFIGDLGGVAVFFAENTQEREALYQAQHLDGWQVAIHPLIYAYSPAAFDAQTAYTLRAYRGADWERLRQEKRPRYGDPNREAETGREVIDDE